MTSTWNVDKKFLPSREWLNERISWRKSILELVRKWVGQNSQGPYDRVMHNVLLKRLERLEELYRSRYRELLAAPFDAHDGALLIVLPRHRALKLARSLFQHADVDEDDVKRFNMDWFIPR